MSFLKKLFGAGRLPSQSAGDPDNTRLNHLLDEWSKNASEANYGAVMQEILHGNSCLLVPTLNEPEPGTGWKTLEEGSTLELSSVYNLDGLQILAVFTDAASLLQWAKEPTRYTAMRSNDVLEMCKNMGIDRIVINNDLPTMYVMERNRDNIKTSVVEQETRVLIGTPKEPLKAALVGRLQAEFEKVDTILAAYQCAMSRGTELSILLGVQFSVVSENSRAAMHHAINNAFAEEQPHMPVDILVIEDESWLANFRGVANSLVYVKKE